MGGSGVSGRVPFGGHGRYRRVRLVRRSPLGRRVLDAVRERSLRIEQVWADQVGHERYRVFRGVLEELALECLPE